MNKKEDIKNLTENIKTMNIKFRGKRVDNGTWVYGYLLVKTIYQCIKPKENTDKYFILVEGFADWDMSRPVYEYEVTPETVGQYTGLKDKNETEIYVGDIVKVGNKQYEVIYKEYKYILKDYYNSSNDNPWDAFECYDYRRYEIIGNVWNNLELLK